MTTKQIISECYANVKYMQSGLNYLTADLDKLTPFEQAKNLRELKAVLKHLSFDLHGLAESIDSLQPLREEAEKDEHL